MVDVVKAKATDTVNHINDLLKQTSGAQPLSSCLDVYNVVIQAKVPKAGEALSKGDPKFAEQGMNDVGLGADLCENSFSGSSSPLTYLNKTVRDVADMASAIVQHFDMHMSSCFSFQLC
ncbi:putative pectinesterase inhibitor domain, Cell wall/vacuolar inhibitor of fructosidase [Rosa chinensis]|uniref:Putative pectinesterase inhibitor domain, Cell wall/vacuolar inhibitor of fructosidase n=1 Tax=Rosa chinensis TaxID=74649 RepID=A0A2P6QSM5_ROSCH|nr:putative pectinesterase inhibitor domain, Cell wall/vacuolar inhibitor of fructosidase [Rosa chinensis]